MLLKDFVYGVDKRAKDVHIHKFMKQPEIEINSSLGLKFQKLIKLLKTNYRSWAKEVSPERPLSFRPDRDFKGNSNAGKSAQMFISLVQAEIETLEEKLASSEN